MRRNDQFPVASSIAACLNFLGWLLVAVTGVATIIGIGIGFSNDDTLIVAGTITAGLVFFAMGFQIIMFAECAGVLFAIERNTRTSAQFTETTLQQEDVVDSDEDNRIEEDGVLEDSLFDDVEDSGEQDTAPSNTSRIIKCPWCQAENEIQFLKPGDRAKCKSCGIFFTVSPVTPNNTI